MFPFNLFKKKKKLPKLEPLEQSEPIPQKPIEMPLTQEPLEPQNDTELILSKLDLINSR